MTTTEARAVVFKGTTLDLPGPWSRDAIYATDRGADARTLWNILEATAAQFPRAAAIDDGETIRDYGMLVDDVSRLGDRLAATGVPVPREAAER
jgi:hypothetical protein